MLLRHERRTILEAAAENVVAFDEAVYDLRRERMVTASHLKAAELKLLVLRQVLQGYESLRNATLDLLLSTWVRQVDQSTSFVGYEGAFTPR